MGAWRGIWVGILCLLAGCVGPGPRLAPLTAALPEQIELDATAFYPQEEYQCGPAALATLLDAAGVAVTPTTLAPKVYLPGRKGTLQTELLAATRSYDRLPYVLSPELSAVLAQVASGRPVLVMQNLGFKRWPAWHFAVIVGYDARKDVLILRSGTQRRLVLSAKRFELSWALASRWALLALTPEQLPAEPDLERFMTAAAGLEAVGKTAIAERAYHRAQAHWPDAALPWLGLANLSFASGDLMTAERRYRDALLRDPQNLMAHNNLAETYYRRGCLSAAAQQIGIAQSLAETSSLRSVVARTAAAIDAAQGAAPQSKECPDLH
jgi:tetratricopeptide (TPR) repeat protein